MTTAPKRPPGSLDLLRILAWLLASCATATFAHGVIESLAGAGLAGDDYSRREHGGVAPVALAALVLAGTAFAATVLRSMSRSRKTDPVTVLQERFGTMPVVLPCLAVAIGGLGVLVAMEFSEQIAAAGRIEGVADALGGNVATGLAAVAAASALVTTVCLRCAQTFVVTAATVADALVAWVCVAPPAAVRVAAPRARESQHRRHTSSSAFLARSSGLRAPPRTRIS